MTERPDFVASALNAHAPPTAGREAASEPVGLEPARTLVLWLADHCMDGRDVDGGDLQDKLEELGFAKRVPATEDFRAEWDADEMLVVSWPEPAEQEETRDGE